MRTWAIELCSRKIAEKKKTIERCSRLIFVQKLNMSPLLCIVNVNAGNVFKLES